jgi:hypothetical protein
MATLLLLAAAAGAVSSRVGGAQPLLARARVRASSTGAPQSFGGDASMPPSLLADAWGKADKVRRDDRGRRASAARAAWPMPRARVCPTRVQQLTECAPARTRLYRLAPRRLARATRPAPLRLARQVNDLMTRLKGCSIHVVGPRTGVTAAASLALARRLKEHRYRFLDLDGVVSQLLGAGAAAAPASEMRAVETAVLAEAKAWSRTVLFCAGEPGLQSDNWAALHQGICVHVATEAAAADELWVEQSDVTVTLAANVRAGGGVMCAGGGSARGGRGGEGLARCGAAVAPRALRVERAARASR